MSEVSQLDGANKTDLEPVFLFVFMIGVYNIIPIKFM
ncbi:MAG: hypothetical protein ACI808_001497 [Paraglaciecola sp.]|jgi:hypothetical protein